MSTRDLKAFTDAYVEAALWSSNDESDEQGGEPLDANYGPGDIAPATKRAMERDCASFFEKYGRLIEDDESPAIDKHGRWSLAGYDFWLTRNGHGAGFGDGNFPKHDDELYEAAKEYGYFELYVGDDGVIYAMGHEGDEGAVNERRRGSAPRRHAVQDFNTIRDLIEHEYRTSHPTHVLVTKSDVRIYYPAGLGKYEESRAWHESGYWHSQAPKDRKIVVGLPRGTEEVGAYLARSSGHTTGAREAFGRRTQWTDWMILDAIDKGNILPPEAEHRALKLAQLGFIDTTGTWRLTTKGRRVVDQRVPVAAEAARAATSSRERPPKSFRSPGGRGFTTGAVQRTEPHYEGDPHWSDMWPILYQDQPAGKLFRSASYGPDKPWSATIRELYWKHASGAAGIGYDVAAFATPQEALEAWARSADQILDWREGKDKTSGGHGPSRQRTSRRRR